MKFRIGNNRKEKILSFSSILPDVIDDLDLKDSFIIENIRDKWPVYAGNIIASHSQPERIFKKILFVSVDHPVYANELSLLKGGVLKNIKSDYGDDFITDLRFEIKKIKWKISNRS